MSDDPQKDFETPAEEAPVDEGAASQDETSEEVLEPESPSAAPASSSPFPWMAVVVATVLGAGLATAIQFGLAQMMPEDAAPAGGVSERMFTEETRESRDLIARLSSRVAELESASPSDEAVTQLRSAVRALQTQIGDLAAQDTGGNEEELAALAEMVAATDRQLTELSAAQATLASRVPQDLSAQLSARALATDVATLTAEVDALAAELRRNEPRRAALALGLAQLSRAAQGSDPFAAEIEALSALRPGDRTLSRLRPMAEAGVPTEAMLVAQFPGVARRALRASTAAEGEPPIWERVWAWLTQSVSLRRTGELEGQDAEAIIARAEQRLAEGNLSAAVVELDAVTDGGEELDEWKEAAQARVYTGRLIDGLSADIIRELEQ